MLNQINKSMPQCKLISVSNVLQQAKSNSNVKKDPRELDTRTESQLSDAIIKTPTGVCHYEEE